MKRYFILLLIGFISCQETTIPKQQESIAKQPSIKTTFTIPNIIVNYDALVLHRDRDEWTHNDQPYSGYALTHFSDGTIASKTGFLKGKKQGRKVEFYPDGYLKQVTMYHQNLMHGVSKNWFETKGHPLLEVRNYHMGKPHGKHQKWHKTGETFKITNYYMGKKQVMQRTYHQNSSKHTNYTAQTR